MERAVSFAGATAEEGAPLRPVISVEASAHYSGEGFRLFREVAIQALRQLGQHQTRGVIDDFCRVMRWLRGNLPGIIWGPVSEKLAITFDNRYTHAEQLWKWMAFGRDGSPRVLARLGCTVSSFANTLFKRALPPTTGPVCVEKLDFLWSEESLGIQAADLLANLVYHALRYESGFTDPKTKLKRDLLRETIREGITCEYPRRALRRSGDGLTCIDPELRLRMQLNPKV